MRTDRSAHRRSDRVGAPSGRPEQAAVTPEPVRSRSMTKASSASSLQQSMRRRLPGNAVTEGSGCRGSPALAGFPSWFFEPETDLHRHLERRIRSCLECAPDLGHLEPVNVPQCLPRPRHGVADRLINAIAGTGDNLRDAIYGDRPWGTPRWYVGGLGADGLAEVAASDRQSGADDVGRFVGGEEEYGCRLLVQCGVPLEV